MVSPRSNILDELERNQAKLSQRAQGLFKRARLIAFDEVTGASTVQVFGRFGTAEKSGCGSLTDSPGDLLGLSVLLLIPTGRLSEGAYVVGPASAVTPIADFTSISYAGDLEARDRLVGADMDAWRGVAIVPKGRAAQITGVVLVVRTLTEGSPVMAATVGGETLHFRQVGFDGAVYRMAPVEPLTVLAPDDADSEIDLTLSVDRLSLTQLSDAVLTVGFSTDSQPTAQRLPVTTTQGAGLPTMRLLGRLN